MIGYILMGLGAYLVYDDIKKLKKGGADENILENGSRRVNRDSSRESHSTGQESDRDRRIGVPITKTGDNENELSQKSIQQVKLDTPGGSIRDDRGSQSDATPVDSKAKGVKRQKSEKAGGQDDAGNENNLENGAGNHGNNVDR